VRIVLFVFFLSVSVLASDAGHGQQPAQTYALQTYAPQTWSPQTFAPQIHSPQTWSAQTGESQSPPRPRRRPVKCMISYELNDYCIFYSGRDVRRGSSCSCDGSSGSVD
jgi:hypothetical protein